MNPDPRLAYRNEECLDSDEGEESRQRLVIDKIEAGWSASIAVTDLALASYPVAVERGFMPRAVALERR